MFVSDKKIDRKIQESNFNQEQRGRQEFVMSLNDENPSLVI